MKNNKLVIALGLAILLLAATFLSISCSVENEREQEVLNFENFEQVSSVVKQLSENGPESKNDIAKLSNFNSMSDAYYEMEGLNESEISKYLEDNKNFITKVTTEDETFYRPTIQYPFSYIVNKEGLVIVDGQLYNLFKENDLQDFTKEFTEFNNIQSKELADLIIDHWEEGGTVGVSTNKNVLNIPSSAIAHVETWPGSTYRTTWFNVTANGRKTKIQMWKGHLSLFKMTGAEMSVWKPHKFWYLKLVGFFKWRWAYIEYWGLDWYPYEANQLYFSWYLKENSTGRIIAEYGNSDYEKSRKWWAGEWRKNYGAYSKYAKDYTLYYNVRDSQGHGWAGSW